jgi:glycosyltransferase involved in cell wall biosynthesis
MKLNLAMHRDKLTVFPLNRRIMNSSKGIVVHSHLLKEKIQEINSEIPIEVIPLGVKKVCMNRTKEESRRVLSLDKYGIKGGSFVMLSFGFIQEHKGITEVLHAFKKFLSKNPDSFYILVGPRNEYYDIDSIIKKLNLDKNVIIIDNFIPMEEVNEHINASNLCFNLRNINIGSSSASLHKILAVGKPCVVTGTDTFSEYPKGILLHVNPDDNIVPQLSDIMEEVKKDASLEEEMSKKAREFAENNLLWEDASKKYVNFLKRFVK